MKMDIIKIKEAFNVLMRLGVTEVSLPYKQWYDLEWVLRMDATFNEPHIARECVTTGVEMKIYGVKVSHEGL